MNTRDRIETTIRSALNPDYIELANESHQHNVPDGSESHFKLIVVSEAFRDVPLVQRHRRVNGLLKNEFESGLHALALHTLTPEEWYLKGGSAPDSPECMGGGKQT